MIEVGGEPPPTYNLATPKLHQRTPVATGFAKFLNKLFNENRFKLENINNYYFRNNVQSYLKELIYSSLIFI
jgi:hypothetical protein